MKIFWKSTYWITTAIICLMMLFSTYSYLTNEQMKSAFIHLGFPDYFRVELAFIKLIGVVVLVLPIRKEFKYIAYAGFAITFISAFIAHTAVGDPASAIASPVILSLILVASFIAFNKTNTILHLKTN